MNDPLGIQITNDGQRTYAHRRSMRLLQILLATLFVAAAAAGVALAVDLLREMPQSAAPNMSSATTGNQSSVWTTPLDPQPVSGDPNLSESLLLSTSGANAANVQVGYYVKVNSTYYYLGKRTLGTLTHVDGSVVIDAVTYYTVDLVGTAMRSATHYDVRVIGSVSAGNAYHRRWTYGASGAAAR